MEGNVPFRVLIANFIKKTWIPTEVKTVTTASPHLTAKVESPVTTAEVLRLVDEAAAGAKQTPSLHGKHNSYKRDLDVLNRHLADDMEAHLAKDDTTVTAETTPISVPYEKP